MAPAELYSMDPNHAFAFGDQEGMDAYRNGMLGWLEEASSSPGLAVSSMFTLTLKGSKPHACASPSTTRPLHALPFRVATLQMGSDWHSQVWLARSTSAAPCGNAHDSKAAVQAVFKFVIPSHGDMIEQGSTLPYFFGVHEVVMPWDEPAWVLAFEWFAGPGDLCYMNEVLIPQGETKYRDVELYTNHLTLSRVHKKSVDHLDVRDANILVDEVLDQAVWIDWTSNHYFAPGHLDIIRQQELGQLDNAFQSSNSESHHAAI
ncbi:hypothetical protein C8T65DRAFT_830617 [Cerioporus squamosus]|nr:hypothetical protein C8T65DRAFT_830617 [Cerioporus squamosus]